MILFAVIACFHTLLEERWDIPLLELKKGGGDDTNTWGDRLQTLAHPFKQFHKILK